MFCFVLLYPQPQKLAPFEEDQTRFLIILANPRTGSSFTGTLFTTNPETFYIFEPVDAVYAAMYGVDDAWTVATDIVSFSNGTQRLTNPLLNSYILKFE